MQKPDSEQLLKRVRELLASDEQHTQWFRGVRQFSWGYEIKRPGDLYAFEGYKSSMPFYRSVSLFQYTLDGWGEYAEGSKVWRVEPGMSFTVPYTADYRYYLPKDSPGWTFIWFVSCHPYVGERIKQMRKEEDAVQVWEMSSPALNAALALFEAACREKLREVWNYEELLFTWLLETERELHHRRYPGDDRDRLLDETRRVVLDRLQNPPSAAQLADLHHQERTTFSRKFKSTTGTTPAAFVTEIQLEEALKLLRTEAKLEDIASRTGFGNANNFCKVFRRHFHTSPGSFRNSK